MAKLSVSSTMQIGNHVKNRRVEGFGEQNGDFVVLHNQKLAIDDSDFMDAQSSKQG